MAALCSSFLVAVVAAAILGQAQGQACNTSIADAAAGVPELSTLVEVVTLAGLADRLSDPSLNVTLFAPTNAAFAALVGDLTAANLTLADITSSTNNVAASTLLYHVVPVPALASQLTAGENLPTLLTRYSLTVGTITPNVTIIGGASNATVITPNIKVCNSVVHIVNAVLLPATLANIPPYKATTIVAPAMGNDDDDEAEAPAPAESEDDDNEAEAPAPAESEDDDDEAEAPAPAESEDDDNEAAAPGPAESEDDDDEAAAPAPAETEDDDNDAAAPGPAETEDDDNEAAAPGPAETEDDDNEAAAPGPAETEDDDNEAAAPAPAPSTTTAAPTSGASTTQKLGTLSLAAVPAAMLLAVL